MTQTDGPVRHAVAFVIFEDQAGESPRVLTVLRPPDDPELPDVWGLPAASVRPSESPRDAVGRAGREKLGVELEVGGLLRQGTRQRRTYLLSMQLFQAKITAGAPAVPQPFPDVTQYASWRWAPPESLYPAADRGSLCCRLFLDALTNPDDS